jgi:hypothetical protein
MFRIDNTDNVIDVNTGNLNWEYDQVTILAQLYQYFTNSLFQIPSTNIITLPA